MGGPYVGATANLVLLVGRGLVLALLLTPALRRQFGVRLPSFD